MLVSVVVIAFDRKEFLKEAIESVLEQEIPRETLEIIVVKNFRDKDLDAWFESNNVRNIHSKDESLGGKISEGLENSSGEVICLLEDDDYFSKNKISIVAEAFQQNENLGYYHNDFVEVDEKGEEREQQSYKHPDRKYLLNSRESMRKSIAELFQTKAIGNNSSIAVRREVLESLSKSLPGLNQYLDNLLFFTSYMLGYHSLVDDSKLSFYRLHSSSSNFFTSKVDMYAASELKHLNQSLDTFYLLSDLTKKDPIHEFVLNRLNEYKMVISLLDDTSQSNLDYQDFFDYLSSSLRLYYKRNLKRELIILLFSIIKRIFNLKTRSIYFKLLSTNYQRLS